ncbi:MAG: ATP-binding protein [Anaerovoracaceae bacterium]|jgi:hypothetical protein
MRLVECHVENFGRLKDLQIRFDSSFHEEKHENGWGKSTLATFIKSMFYGLDQGKRKKDGERARFAPWQGGTFGGQLTFENSEGMFRIERTFGATAAKDTFDLYDAKTGLASDRYSKAIGEELFGLNETSFTGTAFVAQLGSKQQAATDEISAKLGGLEDTLADMRNYDKAQDLLEAAVKDRSGRAKDYAVTEVHQRIAQEKSVIQGRGRAVASAEEEKERIEEEIERTKDLRAKGESLQKEIAQLSEEKDLAAERSTYELLTKNAEEAEQRRKDSEAFFPGGIPDMETVQRFHEMAGRHSGRESAIDQFRFTPEEREEYGRLNREFRLGVPRDEEIRAADQQITKLTELKTSMQAGRLSNEERQKLFEYDDFFHGDLPTDEEVDRIRGFCDDKKQKESQLPYMKGNLEEKTKRMETIEAAEEANHRRRILKPALLAGGAGLAVAGILVLALTSLKALGIVLIVIGAAAAAGGWFSGRKQEGEGQASGKAEEKELLRGEIEDLRGKIEEQESEVRNLNNFIQSFLARYGIDGESADSLAETDKIRDRMKERQRLHEKDNAYQKKNYEAQITEVREEVDHFLRRYFDPDRTSDLHELTLRLSADKKRFHELDTKHEKYQQERLGQDSEGGEVDEYIASLGFPVEEDRVAQLSEIRDRLAKCRSFREEAERSAAEKEAFEKTHDLEKIRAARSEFDSEQDLKELNERYAAISDQLAESSRLIASCESRRSEALAELDRIAEAEQLLAVDSEKLSEMKKECAVLKKTQSWLKKSRDAFLAEYTEPIMKGFRKYYRILTGEEAENFLMDANLDVAFREEGVQRRAESLSEGYQDLVGLCRSMALVDTMFEGEKPFVLFDDPFVNYDDDKVKGGLEFLKQVSKEYQVIYFTCFDGRSGEAAEEE